MDEDLRKQIEKQGEMIEKLFNSVEKLKKIFIWLIVLAIVFFIAPLIGLIFVIPNFLSMYSGMGL